MLVSGASARIDVSREEDRSVPEHIDEPRERNESGSGREAALDPRYRRLRDPGRLRQAILAEPTAQAREPKVIAETFERGSDRAVAIRWSVGHDSVKPMALIAELSADLSHAPMHLPIVEMHMPIVDWWG
jgi:hypothetical protein